MPEDNKNFFQPIYYLWGDEDYNKNFKDLQSTIFQVVCRSQALLKKIEQYDFSQSSKNIIQKKDSLYNQTISCLKRIVDKSFDLSELLKQLDSYVTVFRDLQMENMQELVSSMQARAGKNALEALRVDAVPYVPETELSIAPAEKDISSEPVITSTTTISEGNVKPFEESKPAVLIDGKPPQDNTSEPQIIMNISDPAISSVEGLASSVLPDDGIKENNNPAASTASNDYNAQPEEPVIEYDDGLVPSNIDGNGEENDKSPENDNLTVSAKSNDLNAQPEEPVIEYDDGLVPSNIDGNSDENDKSPENDNLTVSAKSNVFNAQPEEPVIEYDDGLVPSNIDGNSDENDKSPENDNLTVSAKSNVFNAQPEEPVIEYDDGLVPSNIDGNSDENDKSPENDNLTVSAKSNVFNAQPEEPVIEYDDGLVPSNIDGNSEENDKSPENDNPAASTASNDSQVQPEEPVMESADSNPIIFDDANEKNNNSAASTESNVFNVQPEEPVMESADSNPIIFDDTTAVSGETDDSISNIFAETTKKNDSKVIPFPSQLIGSEHSNVIANDDINDANLLKIPLSPTIPNEANSDIIVDDVQKNDEPTIKTIFEKTGSGDARAILVTQTQGNKLRKSRPGQEALFRELTNASDANNVDSSIEELLALDDESFNKRLESMVDKATDLYNSGNLDDAQAMFDMVEEINQRRRKKTDDAFVYKKVA